MGLGVGDLGIRVYVSVSVQFYVVLASDTSGPHSSGSWSMLENHTVGTKQTFRFRIPMTAWYVKVVV